jgi:hypothetical protein
MTVFPIFYGGADTIKDMSSANLERLIYYLQTAYAAQLNASGNGYIFVGSGETTIGSATDTSNTQQTNSTQRIINDGIIQGYPSYPGVGTETDTTYSYQQKRTVPSAVSSGDFNRYGMIFYDSANDEIEPFSTEAQLAAVIVDQAITNIISVNEVGSYRVGTSAPTFGQAGTWVDKGTWFQDTTYDGNSDNFKLWLKTALNTVPGSDIYPVGLEDDGGGTPTGNLINRDFGTGAGTLINEVLLPALTRKMSSGLYYQVSTSAAAGSLQRGSFTDTSLSGVTNTQVFQQEGATYFYRSVSTPSGTASTVQTYYLNLI